MLEMQPCHDVPFSVVPTSSSHEVSCGGGSPVKLSVGSVEDFIFGPVLDCGLSVVQESGSM